MTTYTKAVIHICIKWAVPCNKLLITGVSACEETCMFLYFYSRATDKSESNGNEVSKSGAITLGFRGAASRCAYPYFFNVGKKSILSWP